MLDTSVAIDLLGPDSVWSEWAVATVEDRLYKGAIFLNLVVLAELFAGRQPERVRQQLLDWEFAVDPMDEAIARRAGAAQRDYRNRGGPHKAVIADFLIGAHAAVRGAPLITRDRIRFASYFPELTLITPETQS